MIISLIREGADPNIINPKRKRKTPLQVFKEEYNTRMFPGKYESVLNAIKFPAASYMLSEINKSDPYGINDESKLDIAQYMGLPGSIPPKDDDEIVGGLKRTRRRKSSKMRKTCSQRKH